MKKIVKTLGQREKGKHHMYDMIRFRLMKQMRSQKFLQIIEKAHANNSHESWPTDEHAP